MRAVPTTMADLHTRMRELKGMRLSELRATTQQVGGKAEVGDMVEQFFGIKRNSKPEMDFDVLGIELKVLPLKSMKQARGIKERTKVTSLNYSDVAKTHFGVSTVRKKLSKILFVPYQGDEEDGVFYEPFIWEPTQDDYDQFEADYAAVQRLIQQDRTHEVSERVGAILGTPRSGSGGERDRNSKVYREFGNYQRSWALKPSFTKSILDQVYGKSTWTKLDGSWGKSYASRVESFMHRASLLHGKEVEELARQHNISLNGKSAVSRVIRAALGLPATNSKIEEFERTGTRVICPVLRLNGSLKEGVSFPAQSLEELVCEDFETSTFRSLFEQILFLPSVLHKGDSDTKRVLGQALLWKPTDQEWLQIEKEWTTYRNLIKEGGARYQTGTRTNSLPNESETRILHMRPHGRNAADTYLEPTGTEVTKLSFWLNREFVASLLR